MWVTFFCALALVAQLTVGRPSQSAFDNEISQLKQEFSSPLLDKSIGANEALSTALRDYNDKMDQLKNKMVYFGKTSVSADNNTCHELKDALDKAHSVSNEAAILSVQIVAELSDVFYNASSCITINPFVAVNCAAHKLQDGRVIYQKYKADINKANEKVRTALKEVFTELLECFDRVNHS